MGAAPLKIGDDFEPVKSCHTDTACDRKPVSNCDRQSAIRVLDPLKSEIRGCVNKSLVNDLPGFVEFEKKSKALVKILKKIKARTGRPPIKYIEHVNEVYGDTFTNASKRLVLKKIMGTEENMNELVQVYRINSSQRDFPPINDSGIYIMGGSVNDTFDSFGECFTDEFMLPFLEKIEKNLPVFGHFTCFSHQSAMEAFGAINGKKIIKTRRLDDEYTFLDLKVGNHPGLIYLNPDFDIEKSVRKLRSFLFRSGFPLVVDGMFSELSGLIPTIIRAGVSPYPDMEDYFIPLGVTFFNERVFSTMVHTEVLPDEKESIIPVLEMCKHEEEKKLVPLLKTLEISLSDYGGPGLFDNLRIHSRGLAAPYFIGMLEYFADRLEQSI